MNYTIDSINPDNTINVTFDIDGISQCLAGVPLDSLDTLNQFLFDYGTAYEAGLAKVAIPEVDPAITDLVGQSINLEKVDIKGVSILESSTAEGGK